jgi:glycosyl hydrolase family 2
MPEMRPLVLALILLAALPATALAADKPSDRTLYQDGPEGRFLIDGGWLFRLDTGNDGLRGRYYRQRTTSGWSRIQVPHAWNVGDDSIGSFTGSVGWYRKDFEVPNRSAALDWAARFESVNYIATVWLNGRRVGGNRGAYLPFTVDLDGIKRRGVNRLVVRVSSRRGPTDFPPARQSPTTGLPTGGWWNYGGLLREVYLQRIDTVDMESALVLPRLPCRACPATVRMSARVRNVTGRSRRVSVTGRFGGRRVRLGSATVRPGKRATLDGSLRIGNPTLWEPSRPYLYPVTVEARIGGREVASWKLRSGVRSIKVAGGRLYLNGRPLSIRGVGMHEDNRTQGFAVDNAWREWLVAQARELGATMLRTHYPLHPYLHELADEQGLLVWSEIPVYAVKTEYLDNIRRRGVAELRKNIEANGNHASVMTWSIANELSSKPGPSQGAYIKAASDMAHDLDPTRPVSIAVAGYPGAGCQSEYRPLDIIGMNEYFGWYVGPSGSMFDRNGLSGYLDQLRRCYPRHALMITEFGAEANREGLVEDKGTYAFQQDFVNFHLGLFATKPWLSGALYWALNEFRVRPEWEGGNPWPMPPLHQKGLINYDGQPKPAFFDAQRWFRGTSQY